jgi:hypothetical protein
MSGVDRLSRRRAREFPPPAGSRLVFSLVALLATLAIGLTLISPQGLWLEQLLYLPI